MSILTTLAAARRRLATGRNRGYRGLAKVTSRASRIAPHSRRNSQLIAVASLCGEVSARHAASPSATSRAVIREASGLVRDIADAQTALGPAGGAGWVPLFGHDERGVRKRMLAVVAAARGAQEPELATTVARLLYDFSPGAPSAERALMSVLEWAGQYEDAYAVRRDQMRRAGIKSSERVTAESRLLEAAAPLVSLDSVGDIHLRLTQTRDDGALSQPVRWSSRIASNGDPGAASVAAWEAATVAYAFDSPADNVVVAAADAAGALEALAARRLDAATVASVVPFGLSDLRELVRGQRVSMSAGDAPRGVSSGDVVLLVDPRTSVAPVAGVSTIAVMTGQRSADWSVPVTTRILLAPDHADWRREIRLRLVPGAQDNLGDDTLRWPQELVAPSESSVSDESGVEAFASLIRDYLGAASLVFASARQQSGGAR